VPTFCNRSKNYIQKNSARRAANNCIGKWCKVESPIFEGRFDAIFCVTAEMISLHKVTDGWKYFINYTVHDVKVSVLINGEKKDLPYLEVSHFKHACEASEILSAQNEMSIKNDKLSLRGQEWQNYDREAHRFASCFIDLDTCGVPVMLKLNFAELLNNDKQLKDCIITLPYLCNRLYDTDIFGNDLTWAQFSAIVLDHIENYTVPQYGDLPDDNASTWTIADCLKQIQKYANRMGKNQRGENDGRLDLLKICHYCCIIWGKLEK